MENSFQVGNFVTLYLPNQIPKYSLIESIKKQNSIWTLILSKGYLIFDLQTQEYQYFENGILVGDSLQGLKIQISEPNYLIPDDLNATLELMSQMNDLTLTQTCGLNKTLAAICSGERIWTPSTLCILAVFDGQKNQLENESQLLFSGYLKV